MAEESLSAGAENGTQLATWMQCRYSQCDDEVTRSLRTHMTAAASTMSPSLMIDSHTAS